MNKEAVQIDDLIERLRNGTKLPVLAALMNEAADVIEQMHTSNGQLLELLDRMRQSSD